MQRQSLGSPGSKHHTHGLAGSKEDNNLSGDDQKRKDQPCSLTTADVDDKDNDKSLKPLKLTSKPERFIHLIPIITLLCFLILYLSSHDPSQTDLAQFGGFKRLLKPIGSTEIDDFGGVLEIEKGDVLAIRSVRNLQEIRRNEQQYRRLHRKIADF